MVIRKIIYLQQQAAEVFKGGVLPVVAHVASHAENGTELSCLAGVACCAMNPAAGANLPSITKFWQQFNYSNDYHDHEFKMIEGNQCYSHT